MPADDEKSGADPYTTSTAPAVDTTFSNTLSHLQAPHNLPGDGNPNPALASKAAQYPFAEQGVRATETSSTPGLATTVPGT